jgi:hypothetical protein
MYFKNNFYSDGIDKFVVITVATEENENLARFRKSCSFYKVPYIVLGLGDDWKSGGAENGVLLEPGGAQKIIYLRDELKSWPELEDHIVMFTDSYDVVFSSGPEEILQKFRNTDAQIVFSAEKTCWPNEELSDQYPEVISEYRFLNSGGFIGYANQIMSLIDQEVDITYDDQLFYTEKFLDIQQKDLEFIKLDYNQDIFQTLNQSITDVEQNDSGRFINLVHKTKPCVVHANGPSWVKKYLKEKSMYMFGEYDGSMGSINQISKTFLPTNKKIYIGLFLQHKVSDINQVFDQIRYLTYPKKNIQLHLIYNNDSDQYKIGKFVQKYGDQYQTVMVTRNDNIIESRKMVLLSAQNESDFVLLMDSNHIFRNMKSLELLLEKDLDILTPMILEEQSQWVNFSFEPEYMMMNAKSYKTKNIFVTDYAYGIYLIKESFIENVLKCMEFENIENDEDWDTEFCKNMSKNNFTLYVCNQNYYGGIIK